MVPEGRREHVRDKAPSEFAGWIKSNPNHPLLEKVVEGAWAAAVINHGQGEAARRWAAEVESPQVNGLVESWIKEAEIQKQKKSGAPQ